ncbi:MAG: branched-chain amino acid transport system substrate-binding protein, partial [Acidimicrobiaceae bacterium]
GVDGIWNAIDISGFQKVCLAMDRNSFTVKANVTTSQGWSQKVGRDFSSPCRNSIYANSVSVPYSVSDNPVVSQVLDAAQRYDPQGYLHQWVIEGWGGGILFNDAVASMGPAPTRAGVVAYINGLRDYTFNGLFNPLDWRTSRDYSAGKADCYSIAKWDDGAGSFVNALAPEAIHCNPNDDYFTYVPVDDGS